MRIKYNIFERGFHSSRKNFTYDYGNKNTTTAS